MDGGGGKLQEMIFIGRLDWPLADGSRVSHGKSVCGGEGSEALTDFIGQGQEMGVCVCRGKVCRWLLTIFTLTSCSPPPQNLDT